jgi:F420-non-reducing hydrogenase small subunit
MTALRLSCCAASACGGCEVALLDTREEIVAVARAHDVVFWPFVADFKHRDLEAVPDNGLDLVLFSGALRTTRDLAMARLARDKAKVLVAAGSCAAFGGIAALADLAPDLLREVYVDSASTVNPEGILPRELAAVPEGELSLPGLQSRVRALDEVVPVDYHLPGCPPVPAVIGEVLRAFLAGRTPGADDRPLCRECPRVRRERKISRFYRLHEIIPDEENCLLEQGLICLGPVTRAGCGAGCPKSNLPCRGCGGPPPGVLDQGAGLIGTLGSLLEADGPADIARLVGEVPDLSGTLLRFSLAKSLLKGVGRACRG